MELNVGNLPENRLALTNRVYLSPSVYAAFNARSGPENHEANTVLITVNNQVYTACPHSKVPDDVVALNGLHRRFSQLTLNQTVKTRPFTPPPNFALAGLTLGVDLLIKRNAGGPKKEFDTDQLAQVVLLNYEGQVFSAGQILAMDYEGIKVELHVKECQLVDFSSENKKQAPGSGGPVMGQLLAPTDIQFAKHNNTNLLNLSGDRIAGGGSHANIFLKDFDFEKLGSKYTVYYSQISDQSCNLEVSSY